MKEAPARVDRLARKEIWGLPLLLMSGWAYAFFTFFFDMLRLSSWSIGWLAIGFGTFCSVTLLALLAKATFLGRLLEIFPSHWVNVALAAVLGSIKNVASTFLELEFGLIPDASLLFAGVSGFALGSGIFFFCGTAIGARAEHNAILAELAKIQAALINLRQSSRARIREANDALAFQTRDLLTHKLEKLKSLIEPGETSLAIDNLRHFIERNVRPLSESLNRKAQELLALPTPKDVAPSATPFLSTLTHPKRLILIPAVCASMIFSTASISYVVLGAPKCNPAIVLSLLCIPVLWFTKALIPQNKVCTRLQLGLRLGAVAIALAIAPFLCGVFASDSLLDILVLASQFPFYAVSIVAFAFSESLEDQRQQTRLLVEEDNRALSRDQAIFEQQLWLGRRAWQFVIHGKVQSALTAALTRLQADTHPSEEVLAMVRSDLDRAKEALNSSPHKVINLAEAFEQLKDTWNGICEVEFFVSNRASGALEKSNDVSLCVNEIVKEAVSNAVRHGEASHIKVSIDRTSNVELEIRVTNDGIPLAAQNRLGVGTRLIEELTTDWSISSNKSTGLTVFKANLPLQRV